MNFAMIELFSWQRSDVAIHHAELMKPTHGNHDLFEEDDMFQLKPKYVEVEPIGPADKLSFEKETIGVYLSDHPASSYIDVFQTAGASPLFELQPDQRNVYVGVNLASVKTIRTKKGDVMSFIRMSDASGEMEGVVFPEIYRRYSDICKEG